MCRFAKEDDVAGPTFVEITARHEEEAAIEAGVVADPVTRELTRSSQRPWCTTIDGHRGDWISTRSYQRSNVQPRASAQRIWIPPFFRLSREDIYLGAERRFSRRRPNVHWPSTKEATASITVQSPTKPVAKPAGMSLFSPSQPNTMA